MRERKDDVRGLFWDMVQVSTCSLYIDGSAAS